MLITAATARRFETPNAVMRTLAAPSVGAQELSVWEVVMRAGQAGPVHAADREQVWTVVVGDLVVEVGGDSYPVAAGDALRVPAGAARRVVAATDVRAVVASPASPVVTTAAGESRPLPWAT